MVRIFKLAVVVFLPLLLHILPIYADTSPWYAEWIWQPQSARQTYFRHQFIVKENPVQARLAITADNIYNLFINGTQVGHDEDWTTIEIYDILPHIRPGSNIIAVLAVDPGPDVGGLLVEGSVNYSDGTFTLIKSDATWKMAQEEQHGWKEISFDDSGWSSSIAVGKPPVGPWGGFEHPNLIPCIHARITRFDWPRNVQPGHTATVSFQVIPSHKPYATGPIGVLFSLEGEKVFEHWITPPIPLTEWEAGKPITVRDEIILPSYIPIGRLTAEISIPGISTKDSFPIIIGGFPKADPPIVQVTRLNAVVKSNRLSVNAYIRGVRGTVYKPRVYIQLYKGKELWGAETVSTKSALLKAGQVLRTQATFEVLGVPPGSYTLAVCLHNAVCQNCPRQTITIGNTSKVVFNSKPLGYGVFVDKLGVPHRWHIDCKGVCIWDGSPYIPVGAMYLSTFFGGFNANDFAQNEKNWQNDVAKLRMMKDAGITDLYLNPCARWEDKPLWVWQRIADLFDEMGFNYGLQLTQQLAPLRGFHIASEEYNVSADRPEKCAVDIRFSWFAQVSDNTRVMYAAFDKVTGEIIEFGQASTQSIPNGLRAEAAPTISNGKSVLIRFMPEVTFRGDMHDYWTDVNERYFRKLDDFVGGLHLGAGFRFFIDILDNEQSFRDLNRLLPTSPAFRSAFDVYLRSRYHTVQALSEEWGLRPAVASFEEAARLVPIPISTVPDTAWAVDFETRKAYRIDLTVSRMWYDIVSFRDWSIRDFNNLVADRAKQHHNVPVVLKLTDTDSFTNDKTYGGFDGVGMEAYGTDGELVRGCGGGVYSRARQARRTIWELVTETGLAEDYVGYPDPLRLMEELGYMVGMGAKGTFYFYLNAGGDSPGAGFYIFNLFCDTRQLGWMGAFSTLMKNSVKLLQHEPDPDFSYPGVIAGQHALQRAVPDFYGTIPPISIRANSGQWVVPSTTPPPGKRVIVNLEDSPATRIYGASVEKLLRSRSVTIVGHRRNLGAMSYDKYYTDRFIELSDGRIIQELKPPSDAVILGDVDGSVYWMRVGNLTIYSKNDWQRSVREIASPDRNEEFFRDVLGARILDLGPAFQAITNGRDTFLWLLADEPTEIYIQAPDDFYIYRSGVPVRVHRSSKLLLKPRAESTEHIVMNGVPRFSGIRGANLKIAEAAWEAACRKAQEAGISIGVKPEGWRELYAAARRLDELASNALRAVTAHRVSGVTLDGDLSEWANAVPVYLRTEVLRDFSREVQYEDAVFYLGWDDENIYVTAKVKDEVLSNNAVGNRIWDGDSIEVFLETEPENDPYMHSYDVDTYQFLFSPTNAHGLPDMAVAGNPALPSGYVPKANRVAMAKTLDGWTIECAIHYSEIARWKPRSGANIGFTLALNDSDGTGRERQLLWRGKGDVSRNRLRFGRLLLAD